MADLFGLTDVTLIDSIAITSPAYMIYSVFRTSGIVADYCRGTLAPEYIRHANRIIVPIPTLTPYAR